SRPDGKGTVQAAFRAARLAGYCWPRETRGTTRAMADQPALPEDVTPSQFFEQLMPMGFAAQVEGGGTKPGDIALKYVLTGAGGGCWMVDIKDGKMTARKGDEEAAITTTVSTDDWRDAALG